MFEKASLEGPYHVLLPSIDIEMAPNYFEDVVVQTASGMTFWVVTLKTYFKKLVDFIDFRTLIKTRTTSYHYSRESIKKIYQ